MVEMEREYRLIVALRNEKGSYNAEVATTQRPDIVALRNEKGSYNIKSLNAMALIIVALRNEKGSYNIANRRFIL